MFKRIHLVFILGLVLCGPAKAQMPWELLPVSIEQLNDSLAALRASLSTGKADTSALNALIARFVADSTAKANLINTLDSRVDADSAFAWRDSVRLDSLLYDYGTAGDTTSPGSFYYLAASGRWFRAGITTDKKAQAAALDSVNKGAQCRFQSTGYLTLTRYKGKWGPGTTLVGDSLVAGNVTATDSTRSNTKMMQVYGTSIDSATGKIKIDIDPNVWIWEN